MKRVLLVAVVVFVLTLTLNQFDFVANPRHDAVMVQSFRAIGGLFSHASNLQISPYLKATRLIQNLLDAGAEYGHMT